LEIAQCYYNPDNCGQSFDYAPGFTSTCDEQNDVCTQATYELTHLCADADQNDGGPQIPQGQLRACEAECDGYGNECTPKLLNDVCYYGGTCNTSPSSCACVYSNEYCPEPGTITNETCYYGTKDCAADGCTLLTENMTGYEVCDPVEGPINTTEPIQLGYIIISPNGLTNLTIGDNLTFSASCYDTSNFSMTCPELNWTSSNLTVASIDLGAPHALTVGITGITAEHGEIVSNIVDITVSQGEEGFDILIILCEPSTITAGEVSICTAELNSSGVISDVTNSTNFTSSGGNMSWNNFTATLAGNYTINGSYDSLNSSFEITVTHGNAFYLTVACSPQTLNAGETTTCAATATDSYNNSWDATTGTAFSTQEGAGGGWSANVYTSQNTGTWTVTGVYDLINGTTTIVINSVSPPPQPPSPPNYPIDGSVTLGCDYNDPPCGEGYVCINNACVPVEKPIEEQPVINETTNETANATIEQQPIEEIAKANLTIYKNVLDSEGVDINDNYVFVVTLSDGQSWIVSEDSPASFLVDPGVITIIEASDPNYELINYTPASITLLSNGTGSITIFNRKIAEKPQQTPPTIAQALSAYAPICLSILVLLLLLLLAMLEQRRRSRKQKVK